jgi:hypothetical protein
LQPYEGVVENGQVKLSETVRLPEHAKIYVVVPEVEERPRFHAGSPRLAEPDRVGDFIKVVAEEPSNAGF